MVGTIGLDLVERASAPTGERASVSSWHAWDTIELPDGGQLTVRQLQRGDVERLRRLHGRLSATSLRRRFMTACPR